MGESGFFNSPFERVPDADSVTKPLESELKRDSELIPRIELLEKKGFGRNIKRYDIKNLENQVIGEMGLVYRLKTKTV